MLLNKGDKMYNLDGDDLLAGQGSGDTPEAGDIAQPEDGTDASPESNMENTSENKPEVKPGNQLQPAKSAVENVSYMEAQLALADEMAKVIISSTEMSELFQRAALALKDYMDLDWAAVALLDIAGDSIHLSRLSPSISSSWDLGTTLVLPGTPLEKMMQAKSAVIEPDLSQESQFWTSVFFLKQGLRSVVHMPLFSKREVFGALIVGSRRPFAYREQELKLLKFAVCQMAAPIETARMDIQKSKITETEATMDKLIGMISGSRDIAKSFPTFAQELKGMVEFDRCAITMVRGKLVQVFAQYPAAEEGEGERGKDAICLLKGSPLEWLQANKVTHIESDLSQQRQFIMDNMRLKDGLRSEIRVPMFAQGEVFAALELSSEQPNAYTEKEKALLERLAAMLSAPIENSGLRDLEGETLAFINAASHELKTPLTSVVASSGLLSEELQKPPDCVENQLIQSIIDGARSLESRLVRLLELAQLRTRTLSLEGEPLELKKMLKDLTARLLPQVQAKGQVLVMELPAGELYAEGNRQRVEQVLGTMFSNAVEATPQGGAITVRAIEQDRDVVVEIKDTGNGYSAEEQARLFEVYHLAEADRHFVPDLRLALANARQLIKLQGGEMWVESEPGKGSTFAFSLPKAVTE